MPSGIRGAEEESKGENKGIHRLAAGFRYNDLANDGLERLDLAVLAFIYPCCVLEEICYNDDKRTDALPLSVNTHLRIDYCLR